MVSAGAVRRQHWRCRVLEYSGRRRSSRDFSSSTRWVTAGTDGLWQGLEPYATAPAGAPPGRIKTNEHRGRRLAPTEVGL